MTNLAEHLGNVSHDKISHYLKNEKLITHLLNEKLTNRLLWDNVKDLINFYSVFCFLS